MLTGLSYTKRIRNQMPLIRYNSYPRSTFMLVILQTITALITSM